MSAEALPTDARPWVISLGLTVAVLAGALAVRTFATADVAHLLGTGLLVVAVAVAGTTGLGLLARERSLTQPAVLALFLAFIALGLLVR